MSTVNFKNLEISDPYNYQGGKEVTERLKVLLGEKEFSGLANRLGYPPQTLSTWHARDFTPMEPCVRVHLATGASLRWILFGEGSMFENEYQASESSPSAIHKNEFCEPIISLKMVEIVNGEIEEFGHVPFSKELLERYTSPKSDLVALRFPNEFLLIDKIQTNITSGRYLVSVDGMAYVSRFQRLPGKKLLMEYEGHNIEVNPDQIHSLGKVVGKLERE